MRQERTISKSNEWRAQIQAVDKECLQYLREQIIGGFDEERFGGCIGFGNLKRCCYFIPIIVKQQDSLSIMHLWT